MKVLKKPEAWMAKEMTCAPPGGCGTVMEVELQDLKATRHDGDPRDHREQAWIEVWVSCPTCGARIQIRDVPDWQKAKMLADAAVQWSQR